MDQEADQRRKLAIISPATMEQMLDKGNVWYVRHYEAYFDRVYVIYFVGSCHEPVTNGATTLLSLGTGRTKIDLLLAPYRLYRLCQEINPTSYLTADLVYSWWVCLLARILLRARIFLLPVCIPEEIYQSTGKSMSGFLPIWVERLFVRFSFSCSDRVLATVTDGAFKDWLVELPFLQNKLVIVGALVEHLPSAGFFDKLRVIGTSGHSLKSSLDNFVLVYVGRLHAEKLVSDLIRMMVEIRDAGLPVMLNVIGDGPEKPSLQRLAEELGVNTMVNFLGEIRNEDLPEYLSGADAFVSPLTGTALREAALCGLPIVAYDVDWIRGSLKHRETALLSSSRDYKEMAHHVISLIKDPELRGNLSQKVRTLAWSLWSPEAVRQSLRQAFGDEYEAS